MAKVPKIDVTDEMKLKLLQDLQQQQQQDDLEDKIFSSELNAHLIDQLKVMTCENNELRKIIFTKDEEMKASNTTIADLNQRIRNMISGSGPAISTKSAGIISQKFADLCKQNRHLVAEVEGLKTKNAALERKSMQMEILINENEKLDVCMCKENITTATNPDELKELSMKLASVNKRLCESKNRNLELKNEILAATKILQLELGDKFTCIKDLQHEVVGWKGRAQQILMLQSKLHDLEDKLKLRIKDENDRACGCASASKNQIAHLKQLEIKKKQEAYQVAKDTVALKQENEELKKKLDAAKCRIRNLECGTTTLRQKMNTFAEKSQHDDLLINEQRSQIKSIEVYYQEQMRDNNIKINKLHSEFQEQLNENKNNLVKIEVLRKQSLEKTTKIDELRVQLQRCEECSLQSIFFTPMKTATDNEIKKLSELVLKLNERLDFERRKWEELDISNRKLKERKKQIEQKLAGTKNELQKFLDAKKSMTKNSKISINRSESNVSPNKTTSSSEEEIKKVEEASLLKKYNKSQLVYKLELAEERLKIMEDRLRMIEEEKTEDNKSLIDMIQTSKQLFHEALAVLQKSRCRCFENRDTINTS